MAVLAPNIDLFLLLLVGLKGTEKAIDLSGLADGNVEDLSTPLSRNVFYFIVECVVKTYSAKRVMRWIEKHRGRSAIEMITVSDIAYSIVVIENGKDVWDQQEYIKTLPESEKLKYKNPKSLSIEERGEYTKALPKYTQRKGKKSGYLSCGWSKEGRLRYKKILARWSALYKDKDWLCEWQAGWDEFVEETSVCSYWRREAGYDRRELDDPIESEEEEEVCDDNEFCSRGTSARLVVHERPTESMTGDTILGEESTPETAEDESESEHESAPPLPPHLPDLESSEHARRLRFDTTP